MGINKNILFNRLSRILVENGLGDVKVRVGNEEIICIKSILMNGNDTFRKLLDRQPNEMLELYEECEIRSFLEIEKYYSGGYMELNDKNICDILRFSIYYNDIRIMGICNEYLKNHLSESILIGLFDVLNKVNLNKKMLNEFAELSRNCISKNGFKYLNDDELLLKLNLNSLKFILNNKKLMIIDETWLLNRLLRWYKAILKTKQNNNKDLDEFISMLKSKVHLNEINLEELEGDSLEMLKELKLEIKDYATDHICIKTKEVSNLELMEIINEKYLVDDNSIKLNESEKKILSKNEIKKEMEKLLNSEDIKIIEITLMLIIEMKMYEIIPIEMKSRLLSRLLSEYNQSKRNRTIKCLCLFVDDYDYISTIKCLCGKEILFIILRNGFYFNCKSKESILNFVMQMDLNKEEEEELNRLTKANKPKSKEISSFLYSQSEYTFGINNDIELIPSFDGDSCKFSISPSLPSGIILNKETGIIYGKVNKEMDKRKFEVKCKNVKNEKIFKISLEFVEIRFTELNKNQYISISNNGKLMTNTNNSYNHCYINIKMNKAVYRIKYKFHQNGSKCDEVVFGFSTDYTYSGKDIQNQSTTCNYYAANKKSQDITKYCHIGTVVNKNPNFVNHCDGSIYEIIVDMNKREFWICRNNSPHVLLVKDLPSPLYAYAVSKSNISIELVSVSHYDE